MTFLSRAENYIISVKFLFLFSKILRHPLTKYFHELQGNNPIEPAHRKQVLGVLVLFPEWKWQQQ